jgi:hypothetical protein
MLKPRLSWPANNSRENFAEAVLGKFPEPFQTCCHSLRATAFAIMSQLRNTRHEQFAQFVADGLPQSEAYRRVVGNGASTKNANVPADDWASRPGVKERIGELKAESVARSGRSSDELVARLWAILDAGAGVGG